MTDPSRLHNCNPDPGAASRTGSPQDSATPARVRRAILLFLILLTIVVFVRIASSAEEATRPGAAGASPRVSRTMAPGPGEISLRLEEPGGLVAGGSILRRTVTLRGMRPGSSPVELGWVARLDGAAAGAGREVMAASGGSSRVVLSVPVPSLDHPAGLDLEVEVRDASAGEGGAIFPFVVFPRPAAETIARLFGRARLGLFDPEGGAAPALAALGMRPEEFASFEGLALFKGDLIVIGPGGFSRGQEALGPILAARVRSGMRLLLLEQPTLPGTLSEDLRLWPSFSLGAETSTLVATQHPILRGLPPHPAAVFVPAGGPVVRPLLPPTRGNFRVISEMRVRTGPAWQEGVTLLELPLGAGTLLLAQTPLCADFARRPQARLLLANALAYLLGEGRGLKKAFVYGNSRDDLPACVAHLAPAAPRVPADFAGVEILLVAGDWSAPRAAAASGLPPLADVARYLRGGGTILLLNPQPLSRDYLSALAAAPVHFEPESRIGARPDPASTLLEGIAPDDLELIGREGQAGFRLRSVPEREDVEPVVLAHGIAQYRVGRGTLVALTLPGAGACAAPRASSLLARLLTNLGIPLDHAPGIDPDAVSLLNE